MKLETPLVIADRLVERVDVTYIEREGGWRVIAKYGKKRRKSGEWYESGSYMGYVDVEGDDRTAILKQWVENLRARAALQQAEAEWSLARADELEAMLND